VHLGQTLGEDVAFNHWQPVSGGCIHQSWSASSQSGQRYFIKTNSAANFHMFQTEALGLDELRKRLVKDNPIQIPNVIDVAADEEHAWLVLEFIPFATGTHQSEADLGRGLALLHQQTSTTFGLEHNNFIGASPQTNTQETSWLTFFRQHRLQGQFDLAKTNGFYQDLQDEAEELLENLPNLLADHYPIPSLLHGDLWSGNKACSTKGQPILFDPAIYYGDRECDLAMTELFGGFSNTFYAAYAQTYPIDKGYKQRKDLYHLYHILNHANLFGGHYIQQSQQIMRTLNQRCHA